MTAGFGPSAHDVVNLVSGVVSGALVQAGTVEGGIHIHHHAGTRHHVLEELQVPGTPDVDWLMEQPSRLLDARSRVVPFLGRDAELRRLRQWRDQPESRLSVLLLHGPGGQGKTRLAAEFAEQSRNDQATASRRWRVLQAGFHGTSTVMAPGGPVDRTGHGTDGVLLIVDYADRWAHSELEHLLSDPVLHQSPCTRVLLIGRTVRWFAALRGELADRGAGVDDLRLPSLESDRLAMFIAARNRYGEADLYDVPDVTAVGPPDALDHRDFGLTLTVHMAALVAVDAHCRGLRPPGGPHELSAYLLDREYRAWQRLSDAGGHGQDFRTRPAVMAKAVFIATLTGAVRHAVGTWVLRAVDLPDHPEHILVDHRFCYPPVDNALVLEPLYPDRLAEDFLGLLVPGHDVNAYDPDPWTFDVPSVLLTATDGVRSDIAARAITFLAAAAVRWPHVGRDVLYPLLRADPRLAVEAGSAALTAVAGIGEIPDDVVLSIWRHLPSGRHVDLDLGAAAISGVVVARLGASLPDGVRAGLLAGHSWRLAAVGRFDEALDQAEQSVALLGEPFRRHRAVHLEDMVGSLDSLAIRLAEVGRRQDALDAASRAAELCEELAGTDHTAHLPRLVRTVGSLACRLAEAGQPEKALEMFRRVVGLNENLVADGRRKHLYGLAMSVSNLATAAAEVGEAEESLGASFRAVALFTELVGHDRARNLPDLALATHNHAGRLAHAGRPQDALEATRRAVELSEELVAANRAAHLRYLTMSVGGHAARLAEAGQLQDALDASYRAVALGEELVAANRGELVLFAPSVRNHANLLTGAGRTQEALAASTRAVGLFEELAETSPIAYLPQLAACTATCAARLASSGSLVEALGYSRRTVDLYEKLAEHAPTPHLGAALGNHAVRLAAVGRRSEALSLSQRAVDLLTELARSDRDTHLPQLAGVLLAHATRLVEAGRRAEALEVSHHAIRLHEELAEQDRATHLADLAMAITNRAALLVDLGRPADALIHSQRAVGLHEELAADNRAAYLPGLALSLANHAVALRGTARLPAAVTASGRAVACYDEAARTNRAAHLPELATALQNHAVNLAESGHPAVALRHSARAIDYLGELVETNRPAYLAKLAGMVNNHAGFLTAAGRKADALACYTRAVEYFSEMIEADSANLPYYAMILENHVTRLAEAELWPETLVYSARLIEVLEVLTTHDRATHLPRLAGTVYIHALRLVGTDRNREVIGFLGRAVEYFDELAETDHGTFRPLLALALMRFAAALVGQATDPGRAMQAVARSVVLYRELAEVDPAKHSAALREAIDLLMIVRERTGVGGSGRR
ncbi:tetratricopeptide repeat protein [Saccharothrix coeruleofusca]|uniref:Tetratricopeptide repeat protein n=1 Tax=Saccharothrix coeruleofusca TaxID=33919 RepID=A0A918AL92_9PSEU|nr:tetratricopeptide repeat protein [Saccharothrix coeruleofusca]GGP53674.1 hypothetical protein GCM10010185_27310 [Saccharothrix coeruleofusca]